MTVFNKLLKGLKISEEDELMYDEDRIYETEDDDLDDDVPSRRRNTRSGFSRDRGSEREDNQSYHDISRSNDRSSMRSGRQTRTERSSFSANKVVPLKSGKGKAPFEVYIHKPDNFNEAADVCNILIANRPVIVSFEGLNSAEAQRIMDFICGCVHAVNGSLRQVSRYIFIFSPENVDITGDITFDVDGVPTFNRNI